MNTTTLFNGLLLATSGCISLAQAATPIDASVISGLGIRNIGSATMSGRISALTSANLKDGSTVLYVGSASGGLWKSTDGGTTFSPKFDKQPVQSIGAIALDPNDDKTVWVGTGEAWTRNSVSIGDGIYRSSDGGETWTNMGLPNSERIVSINVRPDDSNIVYACVTGRLWSDSEERGLYRTQDKGRSWTLILKGNNASTGCAAMSTDTRNPKIMFASLWDFRRKGWTFRSGGENAEAPSGSGLFQTTDGGDTWTEVTAATNSGFPAKPYGRIAVAVAPSDGNIVYAMVESAKSALFRSGDGGKTWERRDDSQNMVWRAFYFANLIVDPKNPDRIFKPNLQLIQSLDGGKSFSRASGGTHADSHTLWIDPNDTKNLILGDDGGLWFSKDGANSWWKGNNLAISQFYHVSVDHEDPYRVYGGLQDNGSWTADSSFPGGISNSRWNTIYGGDGFWVFEDPSDKDYIYAESQGGYIARIHRTTLQGRDIQPKPNYKENLRWNWNTPIHLSPNEKGTLYIGAQFLFRTRDHGQSWDRISPDLTTNDNAKQQQELSGGITVDNSAAEMHTTIYAISESPKNGKVIWVGTDDGNVQVTRDGGKSWNNVTANIGVAAHSWVSYIDASRHDAATAYATFDRHTFGEMEPIVYKTTDYGKTWQALVSQKETKGLRGYAHVVREDPVKSNILYVGTEFGLWISIDGGESWAQFKGGDFPAVAVRDIAIQPRDHDLVLATHGRGIWIIDDLTPLRALDASILDKDAVFLPSRPQQQRIQSDGGAAEGDAVFVGKSATDKVMINYYQRARHIFGKLKIEVLDAKGNVIETLPAGERKGINRVEWSMQVKPPIVPPAAAIAFSATRGPRVVPGVYTIRMTKADKVYESKVKVDLDPRVPFSLADRKAQFDASMKVHGMFGQMSNLVARIQAVRAPSKATVEGPIQDVALKESLIALSSKADDILKKIVATKEGGAITGEERLREHMDNLYGAILSYEGRPSKTLINYTITLKRELDDITNEFETLRQGDLETVNTQLKANGLPAIELPASAPVAWRFNGNYDSRPAERD